MTNRVIIGQTVELHIYLLCTYDMHIVQPVCRSRLNTVTIEEGRAVSKSTH
jgi:hypothetical protein